MLLTSLEPFRVYLSTDSLVPHRMFARSHVHSFAVAHVRSFACPQVNPLAGRMFARSPVRMFARSPVRMFARSPVHMFARSPVHMFACSHVRPPVRMSAHGTRDAASVGCSTPSAVPAVRHCQARSFPVFRYSAVTTRILSGQRNQNTIRAVITQILRQQLKRRALPRSVRCCISVFGRDN